MKQFFAAFFKNKYVLNSLLLLLTLFAFTIRLIGQPGSPAGFHRDEASIAYNAYSIIKTGRDEWGKFMPLHFKALGDYPPGVYHYLTAFFMLFLGPTELAERLPAIVIGSLLIPLSFYFVKTFFKNRKLSWLTAILVTCSPWFIVQSRAASESIPGLFFNILGLIYFYKYFFEKRKIRYLIYWILSYCLTFYSYNASRVFMPIMHGLSVWYLWPKLSKKFDKKLQIGISAIVFVLSLILIFSFKSSAMRFETVSVFGQEHNFQAYSDREAMEGLPLVLTRVFNNKIKSTILNIVSNHSYHFSIDYLFFGGGSPMRYKIPQIAQFLVICLPFLIIGLIYSQNLTKRQKQFLIFWILIAPIPAAITSEDIPHVRRAMYLFLPLIVIMADGFDFLLSLIKTKYLKILFMSFFILGFIWNLSYFFNQYFIHARYETVDHRSYGYKQAFQKLAQIEDQYQKVIIFEGIDTVHIFFLFYHQYDPLSYQQIAHNNPINLFREPRNRQIWNIDNYYFNPTLCPEEKDLEENIIYLMQAGCMQDLNGIVNVKQMINSTNQMPKLVIFDYQAN